MSPTNFKPISTTLDLSYDEFQSIPREILERSIKDKLCKELYPFITVQFARNIDNFKLDVKVQARVSIAKPHISRAFIESGGYYLDKELFTESDINEALHNTFPERFI